MSGHYYLLHGQFEEASTRYTEALERIADPAREENRLLASRIHLWRRIARLASGDRGGAASDLSFVRKHTVVPRPEAEEPGRTGEQGWDENVLRDLVADRDTLSTMLSMGKVQLAVEEAGRVVEQDGDARRIQALCYLALVDSSLGQREVFTEGVIGKLLPELLESEQIPPGACRPPVRQLPPGGHVPGEPANVVGTKQEASCDNAGRPGREDRQGATARGNAAVKSSGHVLSRENPDGGGAGPAPGDRGHVAVGVGLSRPALSAAIA